MDRFSAQSVAIVGIAAALPGSGEDLVELDELLDARRDVVGPVGEQRRLDGGFAMDASLSECALLDGIGTFDNGFFGLSLREAQQMDPQQRFLLQLSCRAIWDAGYSLAQFAGSDTATVFGASRETYSALFDSTITPLVTGLLPAAQAGRVAHALGLRGPASVIDTACSSSLTAILHAARALVAGEVDCALTGGVRLLCAPPQAVVPGNESILSPAGRARSFDAAADGTGLGEGGVVFLLKTLTRAREDGDPVHAVLLGGAANQDGGRSTGFAAPSTDAQEEVLLEAWRAAGVHPNSLGFLEGHATGTRLGDPIEFEALSSAFSRRTDRRQFCTLSSIKSNIGHLDSAAGAAGLLKAVLAVKTGRRYASAHFTSPNPMLDTERSALRLSSVTEAWEAPGPRRAGVSAFGMTGTNVHLVLEQAPTQSDRPASESIGALLVPLAARSEDAVRRHAGRLAAHLRADTSAFPDVAWVQAAGRDHERWRACVQAPDADTAVAALDRIACGDDAVAQTPDSAAPILLLPHEGDIQEGTAQAWLNAFPELRSWHDKQRQSIVDGTGNVGGLLTKLTLVRALVEAGVSDRIVIGHGSGNLLVDVLRGESDLAGAVAGLAELGEVAVPDRARAEAACAAIVEQGDPVFICPWQGQMSELMASVAPRYRGAVVELDAEARDPRTALLSTLESLYRSGVGLDWSKWVSFVGGYGRRASVPTDLFDEVRCWVSSPAPVGGAELSTTDAQDASKTAPSVRVNGNYETETERALAVIWAELLGTGDIDRNDDFFALGGDSLMQAELDKAIERDLGLSVSLDTYDYPQLSELAAHLDSLIPNEDDQARPSHDPARLSAPATHSQRRMWLLQQLDPYSGAYNVSTSYELDGPVDVRTLRHALDGLLARHSILRTRLVLEGGELTQRIDPPGEFDLKLVTSRAVMAELREHAAAPFDLASAGAARALLAPPSGDRKSSVLQLVLHHAICDEQSMNLLLSELTRDYSALLAGEASPVSEPDLQYIDWSVWQNAWMEGSACAEDADFWTKQLDGVPTELPIPTDIPHGPQQDYRGAWLTLSVPPDIVPRVREAARERNGTVFTWFMTAYAAWLARLCQVEDFLVGVPVAGRQNVDTEAMLGCFINTLPVRIDASGDPGFGTLFERVRGALNGAFSHQRYPFDMLVEQLGAARDASRPPLVQTLLSLQGSSDDPDLRLGETTLRPLRIEGDVSWFDLSAVLWEADDGGFSGIFAYRTALFEEETIRAFWGDWLAFVEAGLVRPDESIHTLLEDDAW